MPSLPQHHLHYLLIYIIPETAPRKWMLLEEQVSFLCERKYSNFLNVLFVFCFVAVLK